MADTYTAAHKRYAAENREKINERNRARYANPEHRARAKDSQRKYYAANVERIKVRSRERLYGLPAGALEVMYGTQRGQCAVCPTALPLDDLYVDHDHACCPGRQSCGACVRGLLCPGCNTRIGIVEDPALLASALRYLGR